jgi:photosystem II stability/assembly factor-like uncharacterized protein
VVAVLVLASCSGDGDGGDGGAAGPELDPAPAPTTEVVRDGTYDWRAVPIGGGGFVTGLAVTAGPDGTVAYARTDVGGAYRWDEATSSWTQLLTVERAGAVGLAPGDYSVAGIAVAASDPDVVALAVGSDFDPGPEEELPRSGRVLVSTDGGASWTSSEQRWFVAGNQRYRTESERLAIDPDDPDHLLFGTQREGLWRSTDGGATWAPVDAVPDGLAGEGQQAGVGMVAFLPVGDRGATALAGVVGEGIYASTDGGGTWERSVELEEGALPSSPSVAGDELLLAVNAVGPDGGAGRLVRLDADGRQSATVEPPTTTTRWLVAADPGDADRLVLTDDAVRDGRLWTSADGGASWDDHDVEIDATAVPWLARTDLETFMTAGRFAWDPEVPGRLWFGEGMGVWRSDDLTADTVTFTSIAAGIEETVVSAIAVPPGGTPIVTVADRQGFRIESLDDYPTATLVDPRFASGSGIDFSAGTPEVLAWVGAQSNVFDPAQAEPRGATSDDGGASFEEMGGLEPAMYGGEVAVSTTDPDVLVWLPSHALHPYAYLDSPVGLYASSDGGDSWTHVSPDGEVDSFHRFFWWFTRRALAADRVNGDFYLLSDEERLYRSTDGGRSWERAAHAPPCTEFDTCHVHGQVQAVPGRAGHLWASTAGAGLHRTDDAGATPWTEVGGFDEARAFAFGAPIGGSSEPAVYVHGRRDGDEALGLWRSDDGGGSWTLLSRTPMGLAADVNALAADPDRPGRVYVGFAGVGAVVGDDPSL